jgi:hypothetical protein
MRQWRNWRTAIQPRIAVSERITRGSIGSYQTQTNWATGTETDVTAGVRGCAFRFPAASRRVRLADTRLVGSLLVSSSVLGATRATRRATSGRSWRYEEQQGNRELGRTSQRWLPTLDCGKC